MKRSKSFWAHATKGRWWTKTNPIYNPAMYTTVHKKPVVITLSYENYNIMYYILKTEFKEWHRKVRYGYSPQGEKL